MLSFVPDIVVLDYLNATDELQINVRSKALRFLEIGYQRELTYRRFDGSFSAFGQSDPGGSTWLTAFVIKSFISAKRFIWIDEAIINSGLEFLSLQQKENGGFVEEGKIIHMGIQGASSSNVHALTAYCLIAYTEAINNMESNQFKIILDKGINFLVKEFDKGTFTKNTYSVIIVTYLLHLLDHPRQNDLYKVMNNYASNEEGNELKYWTGSFGSSSKEDSGTSRKVPLFYNPTDPDAKPVSIEMTAYALLTQLIRDKRSKETDGGVSKDSINIARWLMKQRNQNGGFFSTQDTVVGITALSQFAQAIKTPKNMYKLGITASWENPELGKEKGSYDFYIGPDNQTVHQEYILGNGVKKVNVAAKGKGSALAQVTWSYYTLQSPEGSAFALSVDVSSICDLNIEVNIHAYEISNLKLL